MMIYVVLMVMEYIKLACKVFQTIKIQMGKLSQRFKMNINKMMHPNAYFGKTIHYVVEHDGCYYEKRQIQIIQSITSKPRAIAGDAKI